MMAGCSSSSPSQGTSGPPLASAADIEALSRVTNLLFVPVDVGGTTGLMFVDTGDPFLLLNPATFPHAPTPVGNVSTVSVESTDLSNVQVLTSSQLPNSPDPSVSIGGLLGCTVICGSVVSFNYRDVVFTIGNPVTPSGLMPATTFGFSFKGGETLQSCGTNVTVPRSRVVVSVEIEGSPHTMVVDTGASAVTVDASVYAALTADGRAQFTGGMVMTTSGSSAAAFTRAKSISVGGVEVDGVVVSHDPSFDTNLADVSMDAQETIEGSLGGTFLDNFYVTIDYPNSELHLARYADTSFIIDPAENLGFALELTSAGGFLVDKVFSGTDAATKGVSAGDTILAIDGVELASQTLSQAAILASGKVGTTKSVQFGAAAKLANKTVSIIVGNLLPLP
jgi:hypothetical protein